MSWKKYELFDAETDFATKAGFQLSAGQVEIVEQCVEWGGKVLNKAEVGCGKTVMATVASLMLGYDVSIVTTPPILQVPWKQWLDQVSEGVLLYKGNPKERKAMYEQIPKARWIICSHAIYRQDYEVFVNLLKRRHKEVIVDECFVGETLVTTDEGDLTIAEIVRDGRGSLALSLNSSTNALEWKKIVRRLTRELTKPLLKVTHDSGSFICTDSHKIAVFESGKTASSFSWVKAGDLKPGAVLGAISTDSFSLHKSMYGVQRRVRLKGYRKSTVLHRKLQNEGSKGQPGIRAEVEKVYAAYMGQPPMGRRLSARSVRAHESRKPNERPSDTRKNGAIFKGIWAQASSSRRKWGSTASAATSAVGSVYRRLARIRSSNSGRKAAVQGTPELLQDRPSMARKEIGRRSGRAISRKFSPTTSGFEKIKNTRSSRVVCVEVYKSAGSVGTGSRSSDDQKVFDLEVEDNHNYFANGVLVSNCHWLKNPKSVLFRCVKNMTAGDGGFQGLTGTPISKPLDAYSYIKLNTPKAYRSYAEFEALHVAKRDFFKNPTEFCNLDLLAERLNTRAVSATKESLHGYTNKPIVPDCTYDLSPEHMRLYRKLVDEQLLSFDDGSVIDASTSQKLRQALQQVVVNFDYFSNNPDNRSAAYDLLDQTLEEIEVTDKSKSKLIVWVKYVRSSRTLTAYLKSLGINAVAAYSEVDSAANSQAFMHDDNVRVMVAQAQSVGAGLNPQAVCWESLFLEIDTVSIYARQAMGRIDRMGQKHIPRIKIGRARNTVQEYLYQQLLANDDLVTKIEPTKKGLRQMLLGEI